MDIMMGQPFAVCERGGRLNNEDSVYPQPEVSSPKQRLFIVCDGVGGSEKGEIASALACESLQTYFSSFLQGNPTEEFINQAENILNLVLTILYHPILQLKGWQQPWPFFMLEPMV